MKIALAQIESKIFDLEGNFNVHEEIVKEIFFKNSPEIICFPEASLTGYSVEHGKEISLSYEEKVFYIKKFQSMSRNYDCLILFGMIEEVDGEYFISHYSVSQEKFEFYRKIHLGQKEKSAFSEGKEVSVFYYKDMTYGIQLCYDLHFPELSTIQRIKGADIIFSPHAVSKKAGDRKSIWNKYVCARAYDNSVYLACCNQLSSAEKNFGGGMCIFSRDGEIISEFYKDEKHVILFDYNKEDENRKMKKDFVKNRKPDYYAEILGGIER